MMEMEETARVKGAIGQLSLSWSEREEEKTVGGGSNQHNLSLCIWV